MSKRIRTSFIILGSLAIGQVIWWAYLLMSQQDLISTTLPHFAEKSERFKAMILFEGAFFIFFWGLSLFWLYRSYLSHVSLKNTRDNFLGAISHELRTPIANVKLCLETIERPNIEEEKKNNYIKKSQIALDQLNVLVDNLLTLTTLEKVKNISQPINLKDLTESVIHKIDFDKSKNLIQVDVQKNLEVKSNPYAVELILKNILENSLKYSINNSANIQISTSKTEKEIQLLIEDKGIGMTSEEIKKVFEPFWRSPRVINEAKPGTGVGLTLAHELARKNKMSLTATSHGANQGTKFILSWSQL